MEGPACNPLWRPTHCQPLCAVSLGPLPPVLLFAVPCKAFSQTNTAHTPLLPFLAAAIPQKAFCDGDDAEIDRAAASASSPASSPFSPSSFRGCIAALRLPLRPLSVRLRRFGWLFLLVWRRCRPCCCSLLTLSALSQWD